MILFIAIQFIRLYVYGYACIHVIAPSYLSVLLKCKMPWLCEAQKDQNSHTHTQKELIC